MARSHSTAARNRTAGFAAILFGLITLGAFLAARNHESNYELQSQNLTAAMLGDALQQTLQQSSARLEGLALNSTPSVAGMKLEDGELLLAWSPRETSAGSAVVEFDREGRRVPVSSRPDYHPLRELSPDRAALRDLELTSLPGALNALLDARRRGALSVSKPSRFPPSFGIEGYACLALVPVGGGKGEPERGVLVAVLDLTKLLDARTAPLRSNGGWRLALFTEDGSELWASAPPAGARGAPGAVSIAKWGGQTWSFALTPLGTPREGMAPSTMLLVLGLLFSALLAALAGYAASHRAQADLLKQTQTQELSREISNRLNTEAALRERQEAFKDLFENSSDLILLFSAEGKVQLSNPACTQVLGFSSLELRGLLIDALLEPDSRPGFEALLKEVTESKKPHHARFQFRARGGRGVLLEGEISPCRPGDTSSFRAILADVTERQRIESELRRSQDSLAALVENTQDAIWSVDSALRLQSFNAPFADLHHETEGAPAAVGTEHLKLLDAENRQAWQQLYARALAGERLTVERAERLGGVSRTYLISMNPIVSSGAVTGVTVYRKDITEQKKLDNALRALVEDSARVTGPAFFSVLAQHLASALSVTHAYAGAIFESDSGEQRVRLLGAFGNFGSLRSFALKDSAAEEAAARGSAHVAFGVRRLHPDDTLLGATQAEGYCAVALKAGDGALLGVLGVIHDEPLNVTPDTYTVLRIFAARTSAEIQRTNAESALAHARDAAIESARLKNEFLANMSHEIRTPINGIIGMTELLESSTLPREALRYLGNIRSCSDVLLTLIDDILDFSKIEAGKLGIECVDFNLPRAVGECVSLFRKAAEARGIRLEADVASEVPAMIRGDTVRIRQVLSNLISNAVKFTRNGSVRVAIQALETTPDHAKLRFSVKDTGIGISAEAQARLFKPFVQADGSTTRRFGGSGLGLSICKRLIELMGGEIGVESTVGAGAEFWFTLQLERSSKKDTDVTLAVQRRPESRLFQRLEAAPQAGTLRAHVLLVEDNPINQEVAKALLERLGCRVTVAPNGQEGLHLLKTETFDIVFMDCQMPVLDGYETTAALRLHEAASGAPRARIVAMTAHALPTERDRCLGCGMDDYVAKPITRAILQDLLDRWVPRPGTPAPAPAEAKQATSDAEPPLDLRRLRDAGGDLDGLKRLADLSITQLKGRMDLLRRAAADGNLKEVNRIAHMGVGSCGACGMLRLAKLWKKLELQALSNDTNTFEPLIADIAQELSWVETEIQSYLAAQ